MIIKYLQILLHFFTKKCNLYLNSLYLCNIKLKTKYMTTTVITKTLEKISNEPKEYSLGVRRWVCLPKRVKRDIYEQEFINWMKLA